MLAGVLLAMLVAAGSGCTESPYELVLPPAAFTVNLGIAVAPVAVASGSTMIGAEITVRCPDAPSTHVLACVRASDPLDTGVAEVWCAAAPECGAQPSSLIVSMPPVVVSPRRVVQLVVASTNLRAVDIRGAVVVVD